MGKILSTLAGSENKDLAQLNTDTTIAKDAHQHLDCPKRFVDYFCHFFDAIPKITEKEKKSHVENVYRQLYRSTSKSFLESISITEFKTAVNLSLAELSATGEIGRKNAQQVSYFPLGYKIDTKTNQPIYFNDDIRSMCIALVIKVGDNTLPPWLFSKDESEALVELIDEQIKASSPEQSSKARKEANNLIGITEVKNKIAIFEQLHGTKSPYPPLREKQDKAANNNYSSLNDIYTNATYSTRGSSETRLCTSSQHLDSQAPASSTPLSINSEVEQLTWSVIDIISMDNVKNYTDVIETIKLIEHRIKTEEIDDQALEKQIEIIKHTLIKHQKSQLKSFNYTLSNLTQKNNKHISL